MIVQIGRERVAAGILLSPVLAGLLQMPLVTSIAFGWPCLAHKAKPVMDWLTAHASTRSSPVMAQAQSCLYGPPASVSTATAVLETFFRPDTGAQSWRMHNRLTRLATGGRPVCLAIHHVDWWCAGCPSTAIAVARVCYAHQRSHWCM